MNEEELNQFEVSILATKINPKFDDPSQGAWTAQAERILKNQYRELFRLARLGLRLELGKPGCRHFYKGQQTIEGALEMVCERCGMRQ